MTILKENLSADYAESEDGITYKSMHLPNTILTDEHSSLGAKTVSESDPPAPKLPLDTMIALHDDHCIRP